MTKKELKIAIEKSLKSENFIFLPRHENRFINQLAFEINSYKKYQCIPEYPIKIDNERAAYIDLVGFDKKSKNCHKENILWGLEAKLYSPHQSNHLDMSMAGPIDDFYKLAKYGLKKYFIVLYQIKILKIPKDEIELKKSFQSFQYAGNTISKITNNNNKIGDDWFKNLLDKCKKSVLGGKVDYGSVKIANDSFQIYFIINEIGN